MSITAAQDAAWLTERDAREIGNALALGMFDKAARMPDSLLDQQGERMCQLHAAAEICRSLAMQKRHSDKRGEKTGAFRTLEGGR